MACRINPTVFVNYAFFFFGTKSHLFIHLLSVVVSMLLWQRGVAATKTGWPSKPKILLSGSLQNVFATPGLEQLSMLENGALFHR